MAALLLATSSVAELGCGGSSTVPTPRVVQRTEQINIINVRDDDFSASVFGLLKNGEPSSARDGMLVGVVRRQLAHAERKHRRGCAERAADRLDVLDGRVLVHRAHHKVDGPRHRPWIRLLP
ncbi:MAG: hypothetical protein L6Q76_37730, partial [Polyangiaceae bacterium]|nr:hypothetical protein [Polyangiaceae bacterium]